MVFFKILLRNIELESLLNKLVGSKIREPPVIIVKRKTSMLNKNQNLIASKCHNLIYK